MAGDILKIPAQAASLMDTHEEGIWSHINANPGDTGALIVSGTGKNAAIVDAILKIMVSQSVLMRASNIDGTLIGYWTSEAWATEIRTRVASARTWMAANDGADVGQLAADLTVPEAIAQGLASVLQQEGSARIVSPPP